MNDKDINKIVVFIKLSFGKKDFKYFIGYKDVEKNQNFMHILSTNDYT